MENKFFERLERGKKDVGNGLSSSFSCEISKYRCVLSSSESSTLKNALQSLMT